MNSIRNRLGLIVAVLFLALSVVFPSVPPSLFWFFNVNQEISFKPSLKPGLDMSGGASLLYQIKPPEGDAAPGNLAREMASALRQRVDPQGVRNLVWRPQGNDRLEIQMPLTGDQSVARAARQRFSQAQAAVEALSASRGQVERAVEQLAGDAREARLAELAAGSPKRTALFKTILESFLRMQSATDPVERARARLDYNRALDQVPSLNLETPVLESAASVIDPDRRAERLTRLRVDPEFTRLNAAIDEYVSAFDDFAKVRDTVGDVAELKRLLRGSGVLSFHILANDADMDTVREMREGLARQGPSYRSREGAEVRWFRIDRKSDVRDDEKANPVYAEYEGDWYALVWVSRANSLMNVGDRPKWALESAGTTQDPSSGLVVTFQFDPVGGKLFSELTGRNVQRPLTAVLDGRVLSIATIQTVIGSRGQISGGAGGFTPVEAEYLTRTLNAGSLPAQLEDEPMVERVIGPQLGADNLRRGLLACVVGMGVVAVFLIGYYYLSGVVAMVAVVLNLLLILAGMVIFEATFTLPGVAGIILTIGMAVDANVLIFERLREEQRRGLSIRIALRNAYERAFSAILDSNVTTGITALILYLIGTEDVKGFGLTLMLGLFASLFTALFVTRTIFMILIEYAGIEKLGSIPMTFPKWDRMMNPGIDWIAKAPIFLGTSALIILAGCGIFAWKFSQGRMLDIEFAGGTVVELTLRDSTPIDEVRSLVNARSEAQPEVLPAPNVQSIGDDDRTYEIITVNSNASQVRQSLSEVFTGMLDVPPVVRFTGSDRAFAQADGSLVLPIGPETTQLADFTVNQLPGIRENVGGVAIVIRDPQPFLRPTDVRSRIEQQRLTEGEAAIARRIAIDELPDGSGYIVYMTDPVIAYDPADEGEWRTGLAQPAWDKVVAALTTPAEFNRVNQIGAQVAGETTTDAVVALIASLFVIVIYIWLRFGDLKFGSAAIIALLHDVLIVLGAVGLAHVLSETALGEALMLEAFRINLNMVSAILTVIGFSINDTVVIFDRIRENRQKIGHVDRQVINDSLNQTLSRTLLTGGTTIVTLTVMYFVGGSGIHSFTFVMLIGMITGTYSSVAIASPFLLLGGKPAVRPTTTTVVVRPTGN
jgi:SecD/SecF fusion protein